MGKIKEYITQGVAIVLLSLVFVLIAGIVGLALVASWCLDKLGY